jgi:antibiotic biosynthesis monooxygenase (ABM) superfamily enzyme
MKANYDKTVTVILQNLIKRGDVPRYENWRIEINHELASYKGFLGLEVIPPPKETISNNTLKYHIIFRFDDYANLEKWQESDYLKLKLAEASEFLDSVFNIQFIEGMEQWYDMPKDRPVLNKPPYLKQVMVVICTVYPLIIGSGWLLNLFFPMNSLHAYISIFFNVIIVAALMTYPVMPYVTKFLRPWLYK